MLPQEGKTNMRRGKLDAISITFIIIAGFFALLSFASDQAAVQTEDRVRDANVKYQNHLFHFNSGKDTIKTLGNITHILSSKKINLSNQTGFFLDAVGNLFFNPSYVKNNFKNQDKYLSDLKFMYVGKFLDHYKEYLNEFTKAIKLVKALNLDEEKYGSYIKNIESIYNIDFDYHYKLIESINVSKGFASIEELNKYYKEIYLIGETFDSGILPIHSIVDSMIEDFMKHGEELSLINDKVVKLKSYKNFFILFSILFQILGLTFLLLLFRTILKKIK